MLFYIIFFASVYIALSTVTVYGFVDRWYWLILTVLIFINVFMLGVAAHFIYCAFLSLFVNTKKPIIHQNRYYYHVLVQTAFLVLKIFRVKVKITGKELVPENGNFLFVCNHIHWLDPAVPLLLFRKRHIAFISKKETHSYPVAGSFLHEAACLPIDRENDREALKTINHAAEFIKNGTCSIGIYPEGWVSKSGELLEFRHGSFRIAKKAECPVVVAHISGTDKILKKPIWKKAEVLLEIKGIIGEEFIREHKTIEISNFAREIMMK
ncbi:MAG: 1-acyl-sn-glycerol-3-phosphate acyltransferase [Oscillospiraceae bacterium]|nr:1-acyl-sn-glycerol-3-phosphate acyltransferase [Oscillospiraceae bacterium]